MVKDNIIESVCKRISLDSAIPKKKHWYKKQITSLSATATENNGKTDEKSHNHRAPSEIEKFEPTEPAAPDIAEMLSPKDVREVISDNCSLIKSVDADKIPATSKR